LLTSKTREIAFSPQNITASQAHEQAQKSVHRAPSETGRAAGILAEAFCQATAERGRNAHDVSRSETIRRLVELGLKAKGK
jgi:hypothetical protein